MKKSVKIVIIIALILLVVGCGIVFYLQKRNPSNNSSTKNMGSSNDTNSISTPLEEEIVIDETYDVASGMKNVISRTRLRKYQERIDTEEGAILTDADSKIDFSDLSGVTYACFSDITQDSITEIWIIKMSAAKQYDAIMNKINERLDNLKEENKDSKIVSAILNNPDNISINQKDGIFIVVFAGDAKALAGMVDDSIFIQHNDLNAK